MTRVAKLQMTGIKFGVTLLAIGVLSEILLPHPLGYAVVAGIFAVLFALAAVRMQQRMQAPFLTTAFTLGALGSTAYVYLIAMRGAEPTSAAVLLTSIAVTAIALALFGLEAYVHPNEWNAWKERLADASMVDILLARTIPWTVSESLAP